MSGIEFYNSQLYSPINVLPTSLKTNFYFLIPAVLVALQIDPKEVARHINQQIITASIVKQPNIVRSIIKPPSIVGSNGFWASSALGITGGIVLIHALARRTFDHDYSKKKLNFQAGLGGLLLAASTAWLALEIFNFNQEMAAYQSTVNKIEYTYYSGPLLLIMMGAQYVRICVSEYLRRRHPVPPAPRQ